MGVGLVTQIYKQFLYPATFFALNANLTEILLFRGVTKKVCTADCLLLTVFIPSLFEPAERFPNLLFRLFFHIAKLLLQQIYKKAANLTAGCFGINQKAKV